MKFRKKPVVIEAVKWDGTMNTYIKILGLNRLQRGIRKVASGEMFIDTLEGEHEAKIGDWIIQGVKGELYPCKSDIFEMTYEPV